MAPAPASAGDRPPPPPLAARRRRTSPDRASRRLDPAGPVDLDRRSWLKLRRGNYPIDARLDLHGLTQAEAHERLIAFSPARRRAATAACW